MATTSLGGLTVNNSQQLANTATGVPAAPGPLVHAGSALAGGALQFAGAVTSPFSGNGAGSISSELTNMGHNITNPSVNAYGTPYLSQTPTAGTAPLGTIPSGSTPSNQQNITGSSNPYYQGNTYGSGVGPGSQDYSVFQSLYNNEIGNLQNQANALPAYQDSATAGINMQYDPQYNTLQTQHASGARNLDLAQNQLETSRSQGLRNLGNSLRGALNGYQNQIGVMGAGNSSAAPMIGYALSQQGNRSMADMNTQFNQQQEGINGQRADLEANYKNQLDGLNAWKQSNLNQIAAQYSQQQAQLQQAIMGAQGDEARYLAMYGQTALANQTISQMQQLENQYKDQVGQLNTHFQQVNAPQSDISKYAGPYQISQITPGQLTPLSFQANQDTNPAPVATASLLKKPDQTPNLSPLGV